MARGEFAGGTRRARERGQDRVERNKKKEGRGVKKHEFSTGCVWVWVRGPYAPETTGDD